ncbi:MAG TPA: tetratricopeptide repeat protein [Chitinophagaceae bacterium]|nr:tetratricopeptide repeat protein [Chitinophagaceae bacterium]
MTKSTLFFPFFFLLLVFVSIQGYSQQDSARLYYQKGLQQRQAGRLMEAYRSFDRAFQHDSTNLDIVRGLALSAYDLRRYDQARDLYKKLVALGDGSAANYERLMELSFNMRLFDEAILYAGKLRQVDPHARVSRILGKASYEQENYGDAIRYLGEAARAEPGNAEVPYLVARSYVEMTNYKQAIPFFRQALSLDSSNSTWLYELGLTYYAAHDDGNALRSILLAGEKGYKKDNDYLTNLGIAYLNAGHPGEGLAVLTDLLKKRPSDLSLLDMVADAQYNLGHYDEAMQYWDTILGYDKSNASALYMIGMCYLKKGDKAKGTQLCDKAIEMDPSLASHKEKRMTMGL